MEERMFYRTMRGYGCMMLACMFFLITSCATKSKIQYVDRDVVRYQSIAQHDTLIYDTHDSIYLTVFQKGDTIYSTKYVEKTKWRDRIIVKADTCWRDSTATETRETVKVVVKIPKIFQVSFAVCILMIIFAVYKLIRWLKIR